MLSQGIIRPSTLPWASPVVLVKKKDGGTHFCVDFHTLNNKTSLDGFPMPQVHKILESLYSAAFFSTLDLRSGYWQVERSPESIAKTAFVTKNNQYEILRLPFVLKNAAASFQCPLCCLMSLVKYALCTLTYCGVFQGSGSSPQPPLAGVFSSGSSWSNSQLVPVFTSVLRSYSLRRGN